MTLAIRQRNAGKRRAPAACVAKQREEFAKDHGMPVTRDEVIWGYRYILGRDPENEQAIQRHTQARNVQELRRSLFASDEFERLFVDGSVRESLLSRGRSEPAAIFLHVPKCGGTTLHNLLVSRFSTDDICRERFNGLYNWPIGRLTAFRLFSGHFDMHSARLLPGDKRIVTMLREPRARLTSAYNFLKAHRHDAPGNGGLELMNLARSESLEGFLLHESVRRHSSINNCMVRTFSGCLPRRRWESLAGNEPSGFVDDDPDGALEAAKQALTECAAVGVVERYDNSIRTIFRALDLAPPAGEIERHQVLDVIMHENPGLKPVRIEAPLPANHPAWALHASLDSKLYEFACRLLDQQSDAVKT